MLRCVPLMVCLVVVGLAFCGCPSKMTPVPNLSGKTLSEATAALEAVGLIVGETSTQSSLTVPLGQVISQDPPALTAAQKGTAVSLVLSSGVQPTPGWSYVPSETSILGKTIAATPDGGFIVGGGHNAGYDMYALKLTGLGSKEWDRAYSNMSTVGTPAELWRNEAVELLPMTGGGYAMLGAGNNEGDGFPSAAYLLVQLNEDGDVTWSKTYAPENPYSLGHPTVSNTPAALDIADDGGFVIFGDSYVGMYNLAAIIRTDAAGDVEPDGFNKIINDNARDYEQLIEDGECTSDGGYVLCGRASNGTDRGYMALLIKLDSAGNVAFSKSYQDVANDYGLEAYAVTQTSDGGYVMGGEGVNWITKVATHGAWLAKVDANGEWVWYQYFGHGPTVHYPLCIRETPGHELLVGGSGNTGHMRLAKFTSGGNLLWNFDFDDLPGGNIVDMALTSDGGVAVVGNNGSSGMVVAKVNYVFDVD